MSSDCPKQALPRSVSGVPLQRVRATPRAIDAIMHLRATLGALIFRYAPGTRTRTELRLIGSTIPNEPNDVQIGTIGGAPFFVDHDLDKEWGYPEFRVDVAAPKLRNDGAEVTPACCLVSHALNGEHGPPSQDPIRP